MDGATFLADVREATATELDRLGSEKALIAATDAVLESDRVLGVVVVDAARTADTLAAWTDTDPAAVGEAFATAAAQERRARERVEEHLSADATASANADIEGRGEDEDESKGDAQTGGTDEDAVHTHLRSLERPAERVAGGLIGQPLVRSRTLLQVVNFFVNEGARAEADLARALRSTADDRVAVGVELLEQVGTDEETRDRAFVAATATIDAAYDGYVTALEAMGVDPKPVC